MNSDEYWNKIKKLNEEQKGIPAVAISDDWRDLVEMCQHMSSAILAAFQSMTPAWQQLASSMNDFSIVFWTNMEPLHRLLTYEKYQKVFPDRLAFWGAYHLPRSFLPPLDKLWSEIKDENPREKHKNSAE